MGSSPTQCARCDRSVLRCAFCEPTPWTDEQLSLIAILLRDEIDKQIKRPDSERDERLLAEANELLEDINLLLS